jgi:cellulose synthase/poly-beta-1,6-N-acetylglucosamine synthase-like glycosyltransferase
VNRILSGARGKSIIFLPADVVPKPGCVPLLLDAVVEDGVGMSCGRPTPLRRGRRLVREMVQTLWGFHNWQAERLNHEGLLMHASEIFCIRNGIANEIPRDIVNDDAYLAVAVKNSGYKIKYVRASQVLVSGPQTVSDYIRQRRRIIAGHYQVRKATGKFSQYLFYSLLARPRLTIKLLSTYFASSHRIVSGVAVCLVEVASNMLAFADIARGRSHAVWDISSTTKTAKEL